MSVGWFGAGHLELLEAPAPAGSRGRGQCWISLPGQHLGMGFHNIQDRGRKVILVLYEVLVGLVERCFSFDTLCLVGSKEY